MSRTLALGLSALILAACQPEQDSAGSAALPAKQTPNAELTEPQAALATASQPAAPMSWEGMQDYYRQMEAEPADPLESLGYRAVLCAHLSGEFGDGDPEREAFLGAQVDKHRCEELKADLRAMQEARSDEPAVVARLVTLLDALPY